MSSLPTSTLGSPEEVAVNESDRRREELIVNSLPVRNSGSAGNPSEASFASLLHQHQTQYGRQWRPQPDLVPVNYYGTPIAAYPSINSFYETEELSSGLVGEGMMSPVRRFFCLFVTFDFLLTALMWLLTIVITGINLRAGLEQQVVQYSIYTSLFDLVCLSAARFVLLILTFAAFQTTHWWPVASTTTLSCGFLVGKVFLYSWTQHNTYMFEVVFLLVGFILPWAETWFLDFRVLPLESKAGKIFRAGSRNLLLPTFQAPGSVFEGRAPVAGSVYNFYSPIASSGGGSERGGLRDVEEEDEDESLVPKTGKHREYSSKNRVGFSPGEEELRRRAREISEECWNILRGAEWSLMQTVNERGGIEAQIQLFAAKHPKFKTKFYKVHARLDLSPRELLAEVFYNAEQAPTWNANLKSTTILQIVDEFTDVVYQVTNEAAGGIISSRDFIDLRHWSIREGGVYVSSGASMVHPEMPPQSKIVRGENGPSCIALFPVDGREDQADLRAMVQTDLKGWIPSRVIEQAMSDVMIKSVEFIRRRIPDLKGKSAGDSQEP